MKGKTTDRSENKGFLRTCVEVASLREPLIDLLAAKLELPWEDAAITVDHLIRAEQAGKSDHGLIRICYLLSSGRFGPYGKTPAPVPQRLGPGCLHVDVDGHLGYPALHKLIKAGCEEVKQQEVCVATSASLYPSGSLGDWSHLACQKGVATLMVASSPPGWRHPAVVCRSLEPTRSVLQFLLNPSPSFPIARPVKLPTACSFWPAPAGIRCHPRLR